MKRQRKPSWKPATEFKVTRLKPNGPKEGQSLDAYLYGRQKSHEEHMDNPQNKINDLPF